MIAAVAKGAIFECVFYLAEALLEQGAVGPPLPEVAQQEDGLSAGLVFCDFQGNEFLPKPVDIGKQDGQLALVVLLSGKEVLEKVSALAGPPLQKPGMIFAQVVHQRANFFVLVVVRGIYKFPKTGHLLSGELGEDLKEFVAEH